MKTPKIVCLGWLSGWVAAPVFAQPPLSQPCDRPLQASTAQMKDAQATLTEAKREYDRYTALYQEGAISRLAVLNVEQRYLAALDRCLKGTRDRAPSFAQPSKDMLKLAEMRYQRLLLLYEMGAVPRSEVDLAERQHRAIQGQGRSSDPAPSKEMHLKQTERLYQ
jgi:multidrug resistance efflux pump